MKLTIQQEALIDYAVEGRNSFVGIARAGTGKTFTAKPAAQQYNQRYPNHEILGMAFNKNIANDLAKAMPFAIVKTANGFGHGAWFARIQKKLTLNTKKNLDIRKEINATETFQDLPKAVMLCKAWGLVPKGAPAEPLSFMPDEIESYKFLFDSYNVETEGCPDPIGLVREALQRSIMYGWRGVIDFDDQIYLSTIYKAPLPKADLLIVDEAQDLNPIQRYMAKQMLKPGGRLFALGDDCQAIYGFRGADRDSIANIIEEFDAKVLPLTVSFRCPQAVVKRAQAFVPDIEPFDGAEIGAVVSPDEKFNLATELKHTENEDKDYTLHGRLAILCRNNAPLISAALNLITHDIGAKILGRDLEKGLCSMIDKQRANSLQELNSKLFNYIAKQADMYIKRGANAQAELITDKGKCLEILISAEIGEEGFHTVHSLKQRIKTLFSEKVGDAPVLLSTIHKAKGLEWPNVVILESGLMPSKYAKTTAEIQQENNLHYVAITRAQKQLIYLESDQI